MSDEKPNWLWQAGFDAGQLRVKELEKAFDSNKACLRRHFDLLQTLLEQFDHYADGAPDATDLGKFCNEMIGLYNEISMSDARTLAGQNKMMRKVLESIPKCHVSNPPHTVYVDGAAWCQWIELRNQAIGEKVKNG